MKIMDNQIDSDKIGLQLARLHSKEGQDVYALFEYEYRDVCIKDSEGNIIFEQKQIEVPVHWSVLSTEILAEKFFRKTGVPQADGFLGGEHSIKQVVHRMASCWQLWGLRESYFETEKDAAVFYDEIVYALLSQQASPNSPQWFNTGLYETYAIKGKAHGHYYVDTAKGQLVKSLSSYERPLPHACFILPVEDDLVNEGGIMDLFLKEAKIFKFGGGVGTNFSNIRAKGQMLSSGGKASGLISYLKIGDSAAAAVMSGGATRRSAKMVIINANHPEVLEFVDWKKKEELKAVALIKAGYSSGFTGEAYGTIAGQNSNNAIRLSDAFFQKLESGEGWELTHKSDGSVCKSIPAKQLMDSIAQAAWSCADPGLQFDDTINDWNTCPESGRINASNPCSEFMFLDNTACNLASLNLLSFCNAETQEFDIQAYEYAIRLWTIVLEISVTMAHFPTKETAQMTYDFRPLGMGYTNLGALLMTLGLPYDSDQARAICGALSAILTGNTYAVSAEIASFKGPFAAYRRNKNQMLRVIRNHRFAAYNNGIAFEGLNKPVQGLNTKYCSKELLQSAYNCWDKALQLGTKYGFRNAQASAIAPTGTIGLLMDCQTFGIEPDYALVKQKKMVGGYTVKLLNSQVGVALKILGYTQSQIKEILDYLQGTGTFKNAPFINAKSLLKLGLLKSQIEDLELHASSVFSLYELFSKTFINEHILANLGLEREFWDSDSPNLLVSLGFSEEEIKAANTFICGTHSMLGAPYLRSEHLSVFDTAMGERGCNITALAHLKMVASAQPFVSGAISKTVNMPSETTVSEVESCFLFAWEQGLKSISIYRDGSKLIQPLNDKFVSPDCCSL